MPKTDFDVRKLGRDDIDAMRELLVVFGKAFGESDVYEGAQPSDDSLRRLLGGETMVAMVASRDERVVGGLVAYVLDKFERQRREVYIYDLAVAEPHRRKGVARALIARLKEIAERIGAYVIYVQADLGDDPAIALYSMLGVREDVLHFDIAVGGAE